MSTLGWQVEVVFVRKKARTISGSRFEILADTAVRDPTKLLRYGSGGRRCSSAGHTGFFFFYQSCALTDTIAQVGEFGAADRAFAFHFDFVDTRLVDGENTFHTFAVADAADGEG